MFFVWLRIAHDQILQVVRRFSYNPRIIAASDGLGEKERRQFPLLKRAGRFCRYNSVAGARSSMDRIRVSEALDTGSIPVGRTSQP